MSVAFLFAPLLALAGFPVGYATARNQWAMLIAKCTAGLLVLSTLLCVFSGLLHALLPPAQHSAISHAMVAFTWLTVPFMTGIIVRDKGWLGAVLFAMVGLGHLLVASIASMTGYLPQAGGGAPAGEETMNRFFVLHQLAFPVMLSVFVLHLVRCMWFARAWAGSVEVTAEFSGDRDASNPYDAPRT